MRQTQIFSFLLASFLVSLLLNAMHLFSRFLSLRRRARKNTKSRSRESSGSSFEYGQPSVDRLSGDFDPYQYSPQAAGHPNFDLIRSAGIPIRTTTPRSFSPPGRFSYLVVFKSRQLTCL
jgi:hypothetical protein